MRSGWSISSCARGVADDDLAVRRERNHAGHQLVAVFAEDHFGLGQVHPRDQAVGGAEVDADYVVVVVKLDLEHSSVSIRFDMYFRRFSSPRRSRQRFAVVGRHPTRANFVLQFGVDLARACLRTAARGRLRQRSVAAFSFFERHVEFEDFFQQLRRNVFRALLADIEAFEFQQIHRHARSGSRSVR